MLNPESYDRSNLLVIYLHTVVSYDTFLEEMNEQLLLIGVHYFLVIYKGDP